MAMLNEKTNETNIGGQNSEFSILDKIISSKETQEIQDFNPGDVVSQLLRKLNSKEADVIKRRFGLFDNPKETLEIIGKRYEVTRERIRQIESTAIKKIKDSHDFAALIKPIEHVVTNLFNQNGGVMEENYLLLQLITADQANSDEKATLFILSELLGKRFLRINPSTQYRKAWRLPLSSLDFTDQVIAELVKIITQQGQPLALEKISSLFSKTDFFQQHQAQLNERIIESYLEISQKISRNPFNEYGLIEWGSIMPKRMNDKIYLVLKKEGQPMHFTEIAKKITQIFKKKAYPPTVHNELILNKQYVLVGRGIYALQEWGYKEGVVADVLASILKKSNRPMSRDELLNEVLKQRIVKKNTIYLALTNKKKFKKLADSRFVLI